MPDGRRRSREHWTDSMEAGPPDPPAHVHRLPPVVRVSVVGLVTAVFLLLVAVGLLSFYVYQQQQYIQGKGEQRDAENARLHEQIRQAQCDLLDQLPEGGLLDRPRHQYGCGPGIPLGSLSPQEQAQLMPRSRVPATTPAAPSAAPSDDPMAPGTVGPRVGPGPKGAPTPPPEQPSVASRTPARPLDPVTQPICDVTGLCL